MSRLSIALVGLPNVGKSSLFNAITKQSVAAENYPFCTIDPHLGTVPLFDSRLNKLADLSNSEKVIQATVDFVDIAGLVKDASKGEGLGNKFLANIRETSVICHVLRCFDNEDVVHVDGKVNPVQDFEVVFTELLLADLQSCESWLMKCQKYAKSGDVEMKLRLNLFERIKEHLSASQALSFFSFTEKEEALLKGYSFLTQKPMCFVANIAEKDLGGKNKYLDSVHELSKKYQASVIELCVSLELELAVLDDDEKKDYLDSLGLKKTGLQALADVGFDLLNLQVYLTTGKKESRAWVIPKGATAPQAAGVIHSDFEQGFIRANVVSYEDFLICQSFKAAKEKGVLRQEGKDYLMQDGDVVEFLFNT